MSTVYIALDLEATGMNPASDRIIEVAAVKFTLDRVLDRWQSLVRPNMVIPLAVTSLTGISQAQVDAAPTLPMVLPSLRTFLGDHPIVGQSIELDLAMLRGGGLALANAQIDTFELAALLLPQLTTYGLTAIAEALGVAAPEGVHRADADAELTRRVFTRLWDRLLEFEAETRAEVVQLTAGAGWALHRLFAEAQQARTRDGFGASLGSALRAARAGSANQPGEMAYLLPRPRPEPLEPTGDDRPLPARALRDALSSASHFARAFPHFEHRPEQVQMVEAVTHAFEDGGQLLVEAGTGTGKSMAYLLPAVAMAVQRGEPVVVSTKTIQLQDQLFHKDIPVLRQVLASASQAGDGALPRTFKAALVKGRSNYLCLRRWLALRRSGGLPREEVRTLVKILLWLQGTETGDRAELRLLPGEEVTWARVMATPDTCNSTTCPYHRRGQCFVARARRAAEAAHLVVVNHALLLSDMVSNSQVLPPYRHLIIDEAHRLEDEATDQLGYTVDRRSVLEALDLIVRSGGGRTEGLAADLSTHLRVSKAPTTTQAAADRQAERLIELMPLCRQAATALFAVLETFAIEQAEASEQYDPRLRLTPALRQRAGWSAIEAAWEALGQQLAAVGGVLSEVASLLERLDPRSIVEYETLLGDLAAAQRANAELRLRLNGVIASPTDTMVYWLEVNRASRLVSLHTAPLEVAGTLAAGLYADKATLILTSATLTADDSFGYVRERLGLTEATTLRLDSPFDYERAALLYLADDIPEPGRPNYQRQLERTVIGLGLTARGRTLVLFTSHSALRTTYAAIKGPLEAKGILVLGQRIDGSPRHLLERLRANPTTLLLGTASFWEGVDVVGDALSVLVIAKLPFRVPTDPIFAARCELLENPFAEYAVPQTILTFKQGFGRLIRSRTDRGVVAVLDRRLLSKSYGRLFVQSLPGCTRRQGPTERLPAAARDWLSQPAPAQPQE